MKKPLYFYVIFLVMFISCVNDIYVDQKKISFINGTLKDVTTNLIDSNGDMLAINLSSNQTDSISVTSTTIYKGSFTFESYIKYKNMTYFEPSTKNINYLQIVFNDGKKITFSFNDMDTLIKTDSFFYGISNSNQIYNLANSSIQNIFRYYEPTTQIILRPNLYDSAK